MFKFCRKVVVILVVVISYQCTKELDQRWLGANLSVLTGDSIL